MTNPQLSARCHQVAQSAREAINWISDPDNSEVIGTERTILLKDLRRAEARSLKLAEATERPMGIGVYGPSQAGKSYLASILAKPKNGRLVAVLDGHPEGMDFITEINPEGDKEATGLVTRFTMRQENCPRGFPVHLRLLGEADVIRILINTFLRDGDNSESIPRPEELKIILNEARNLASQESDLGLSRSDMWEIQDYVERGYPGVAYAQALTAYWDAAEEIAPRLDLVQRCKLLQVLWGGYEGFSTIYRMLVEALNTLDHAKEVFAVVESLVPRHTSIIDVATLKGLDDPGGHGEVRVRTPQGREASIARPVIAALTAELILPMQDLPWPIFETSDLLDFPGVRERRTAKGPLDHYFGKSENPLKELFLRGKVGFLFERYVNEQELNLMLLCVPPSNINVAADLSADVQDWISKTQGETPAQRATVDTALFLILTKFDEHLAEKAGAPDARQRFENRIEASLIAPFASLRESWPKNWTPGQPFKNSFWLRNPNYRAEAVIEYRQDGHEERHLPHKLERLKELKQGSLDSEQVRTHFHDPATAWDAALALNDGGINYLVECITPVSKPEIKQRQIQERVDSLCRNLTQRLRPFYADTDVDKRLKERQKVAAQILHEINDAFDSRKFGRLLEGLSIDAGMITMRIERLPENVQIVASTGPKMPSGGQGRRVLMPQGAPVAAMEPSAPKAAIQSAGAQKTRTLTRERFQAETAVQVWLEQMRGLAERSDVESHLHLSARTVSEIIGELAAAARRLALVDSLTGELVEWNTGISGASASALLAATRINALVNKLAVDRLPTAEQPIIRDEVLGVERRAFDPGPVRYTALDMPEWSERRDEIYLQDWTFALYRMFEDNVFSGEGGRVNLEQNSRLECILNNLAGI